MGKFIESGMRFVFRLRFKICFNDDSNTVLMLDSVSVYYYQTKSLHYIS